MNYWIKIVKSVNGKKVNKSLIISEELRVIMNFLAVKGKGNKIEGTDILRYFIPKEISLRIGKKGYLLFAKDLVNNGSLELQNTQFDINDLKRCTAICISYYQEGKDIIKAHRAKAKRVN